LKTNGAKNIVALPIPLKSTPAFFAFARKKYFKNMARKFDKILRELKYMELMINFSKHIGINYWHIILICI